MGPDHKEQLESELSIKDREHIWHPFTPLLGSEENLVVASARGARLFTIDGREIIDAVASWWVNLHGHSHPVIAGAIAEQARNLEHVMFAGFTHEPAIRLAEKLLDILPGSQQKVFFSDNGSTAVEVALKMALQYWHNQDAARYKIIALEGAYHGDTFGAMSVGERGPFTAPFWPFLFQVEFVDPPLRGDQEMPQGFVELLATGEVAAFIFEPIIQGAAGMRIYNGKVLDRMIEAAQSAGVLCIADEVMTGFGRTGRLFASNHLHHKPDIFCLSKGITGGAMALGATTCTQIIQNAYLQEDINKTFFHGHSYTANPIACAAAYASIEILQSASCQRQINHIADRHQEFKESLRDHPKIKAIDYLGTVLVVEFQSEQPTSYVNEARHRLYSFYLSKGVLLRPLGNVVYVLPPYVITDPELDKVYEAIRESLDI